jgi:hypothetical protein
MERILELVARVGVERYEYLREGTYPHGMQVRIGIGR